MSYFEKFNLEDWIRSDDDLVALLNDALASGNQKYLIKILTIIAKRQGSDEVAKNCDKESQPSYGQIMQLFKTLKIKLQATLMVPGAAAASA